MVEQKAKYKIGDLLKDNFTGKTGIVTRIIGVGYIEEGADQVHYSIDRFGWRFLPEADLTLVNES